MVFKWKKSLKTHTCKVNVKDVEQKNTMNSPACQACDLKFDTVGNLKIHNIEYHSKVPCSKCDKNVELKDLEEHENVCAKDKDEKQETFINQEKTKKLFEKHKEKKSRDVHMLEKFPFKCTECDFRAQFKDFIVLHMNHFHLQ